MSGFLKSHFPKNLVSEGAFPRNPAKALHNAFISTNNDLQRANLDSEYSGYGLPCSTLHTPLRMRTEPPGAGRERFSECGRRSTGCVVLVVDRFMWTANVGDSRAICGLGRGSNVRPQQITRDHTVQVSFSRLVHSTPFRVVFGSSDPSPISLQNRSVCWWRSPESCPMVVAARITRRLWHSAGLQREGTDPGERRTDQKQSRVQDGASHDP